jgi:hypothetical protein
MTNVSGDEEHYLRLNRLHADSDGTVLSGK